MSSLLSSSALPRLAVVLFGALLAATPGHAQSLPYAGGVYSQNFDTLPQSSPALVTQTGRGPHLLNDAFVATGLEGWFGANVTGSSANTEYRAHNGSLSGSAGRGVLSLGSTDSADRALGALSTSNQINAFGLRLLNTGTTTLTSFTLAYTGEQWRYGNLGVPSRLTFTYAVIAAEDSPLAENFNEVEALHFTAPIYNTTPTDVALDGNLPDNRAEIQASVTSLDWQPGQVLVLRWTAQDLTGQDPALAIDDLVFAASAEGGGGGALSAFDTWRQSYGIPLERAAEADSDGDGYGDLLEYALGTMPTTPDALPFYVRHDPVANRLVGHFSRLRAELTYTVEGTTDLGATWTPVVVNPGTLGTLVNPATDAPTFTDTTTLSGRRFLRLVVSR